MVSKKTLLIVFLAVLAIFLIVFFVFSPGKLPAKPFEETEAPADPQALPPKIETSQPVFPEPLPLEPEEIPGDF